MADQWVGRGDGGDRNSQVNSAKKLTQSLLVLYLILVSCIVVVLSPGNVLDSVD